MTTPQNPKLAPEGVINRIVVIFLCSIALGCAEYNSVDYRNFAIDTFFPTPNEIQIAEAHARSYWSRNASRFGPEPMYFAVETSTLFPYGGLYPKLINSETTASFFSHGKGNYSNLHLLGIMIYDTGPAISSVIKATFPLTPRHMAESHGSVIIWQDILEPEAGRPSKLKENYGAD